MFLVGGCWVLWGTVRGGQSLGPEPVCRGRTLSQWLIAYGGLDSRERVYDSPGVDPIEKEKARKAVREVGSNAVPFLLDWRVGARPLSAQGVRRWDSAWLLGFEILGTNASAAIPELSKAAGGGGTNYEGWNAISGVEVPGRGCLASPAWRSH